MRRITGWISRVVAAALLVSVLSIWTTGYIVNSYVETLIKQYGLPLETQPYALGGVWGMLWGVSDPRQDDADAVDAVGQRAAAGDNELLEGAALIESGEREGSTGSSVGSAGSVERAGEGVDGTSVSELADSERGADRLLPPGSEANAEELVPGAGEAVPTFGAETIVTPDELSDVKEELTDEDKQLLFTMLMSKLPQEAMQSISVFMEGGLTEKELQDTQQILAQHLTDAEYNEFMSILKKY